MEDSEGQCRYMDDFIVFFHLKSSCLDLKIKIENYLKNHDMGIKFHPKKMREDYYLGKLTRFDVEQKLNGTYAFLKKGDTKQMMRYLSYKYRFTRDEEKYNKDRTYV